MAEYVKSRMTAAKVGVGLALFGLAAGIVERVRPQRQDHVTATPAASTHSAAAVDYYLKFRDLNNKITTKQVKDHSLLARDFRQKQFLQWKYLESIKKLDARTVKLRDSLITGKFSHNWIKLESDARYVKGHGDVVSGAQPVPVDDAKTVDLLTIPHVLTVQAFHPKVDS